MYMYRTLDPHPPTATPILGQSPKHFFWHLPLPNIINYHLLPPHSVLYWPSTQLHLLVTHSWANWIQHMVVNSCIEIINYHFHCHDPLSYCQHMVVHSSVKTINYYYSYHYHCHDHLSYRQHMIANSCVEMHGKSGVRWDKQRANTQDLEISLDWV